MNKVKVIIRLNGKAVAAEISPDLTLLDFCREHGCPSVKCGCDTSNCGLCTVWLDGTPVLSCTQLAVRCDGHEITTLEGVQEAAAEFGGYLADEGAEQCGFCAPGFIMNVLAMERELSDPTEDEVREYLVGNLCRCSGFQGQLRAIVNYLHRKKEGC